MLQTGKKYMFDLKALKKSKIPFDSLMLNYFKEEGSNINAGRRMKPETHYVMWADEPSFAADVVVNATTTERKHLQKIRFCRPFEGFEVTDFLFEVGNELYSLVTEMKPEGEAYFSTLFVGTTVNEILDSLW